MSGSREGLTGETGGEGGGKALVPPEMMDSAL